VSGATALRRAWRALRWRLLILFLLLALAISAVFLFGLQRSVQGGWMAYGRPLLIDYADRLAAEIGSPPDVARAQAIADRLPVTVQIDGPVVQFRSHPQRTWWRGHDHADDDDDTLAAFSPSGPTDATSSPRA
jgi:hypothetical protein